MASINLVIKQDLDITCMKNDTFELDMDWTDSSSNPVDLTAYTFKAQVRKKSTSSAVLTFENSDFTKDASGNLVMQKSSSSMNITSGVYEYDLQATHTDGTVTTWMGGLFVIQQDITE